MKLQQSGTSGPFWAILLLLGSATGPAVRGEDLKVEHFTPKPIQVDVADLPPPNATESAQKHPKVVAQPADARLNVPEGFTVSEYAEVPKARWLAFTPEGDLLCAASSDEKIYLLRDTDKDGKADKKEVFLDKSKGANRPFGMAFADGYFYLGNMDQVLRYRYDREGENWKLGEKELVTELPPGGYNQHWTRNVILSPDGEWLYVSVGSRTNNDEESAPRASVFRMRLDGSERETFASGLRNPVGLDFHPESGELYTNVNERDGLGDGLVPDYMAHVRQGEFYGWPYTYLKPENLDPKHVVDGKSVNPELAAKTATPEVLYEAHSAALGLAFARGNLPAHYRNGAFSAHRGSWNRTQATGYKIVFVPFGEDNKPLGYYEDFVTGFLTDPTEPTTWGRPVGVAVSPQGEIYFTEEANGRVFRVTAKQ
jgi:glucose/arabinose dehydrogenase